uniref:MADS89 n=1 Tax=Bambusa multiplex TaxID=4582 RepID=A0A3S6KA63_BAMML|nr:MADS89 [Bambusa multiplex]
MARKKVNLLRIANDSTRRTTFKKRRKGLMKKAQELSTLCDVKACVVVYGEGEAQPEVWPSVPAARSILERFKAMPELDQCKKMMTQEGFLRQRITKLREQLQKSQRENRERETRLLMHDAILGRRPGLMGLTIEELTSLGWMVEMSLKSVQGRIEHLRGQALPAPPPRLTLLPATSSLPLMPYAAGDIHLKAPAMDQGPNQQGWLMDVARTGGELGAVVYSGFAAGGSGAGTRAGGDMMQLSNLGSGFSWPDPRTSFLAM